jgi:hypothetical protein
MWELSPDGVELQHGCRALLFGRSARVVRLLFGFFNGTGVRPLFLKKEREELHAQNLMHLSYKVMQL